MKRLQEFRIYYNQTIYPELMRIDRQRKRLVQFIFTSLAAIAGIVIAMFFINVIYINLLLILFIGLWLWFLNERRKKFVINFKPRVMALIMNFMNEQPNYSHLAYSPTRIIGKGDFLGSGLFPSNAEFYRGEDYISGKVGEMIFRMCEIDARGIAIVSNRLQQVFRGLFVHAIFNEPTNGRMYVWPRERKHLYLKMIKQAAFEGCSDVSHEIMNPEFNEMFIVYAKHSTHVIGILSEPMQEAIVNYVNKYQRHIFISFKDKQIFAGVTSEIDLLEPNLFQTNVSFDLMRRFFRDVEMALDIIQDFDQTH